jgi:uncharacterized integral membrane protein
VKRLKLFAGAVVVLCLLIVILQNTESVETRILFVRMTMPRALLLTGSLLLGYALGVGTCLYLVRKRRKEQAISGAPATGPSSAPRPESA